MNMKRIIWLLIFLPLLAQGRSFKIGKASVYYDDEESYQVVRAIGDLKRDIAMVTGLEGRQSQIVVGTYGTKTISNLIAKGVLKEQDLKGKWESYVITVTDEVNPRLVIAGSDKRGTIYGIYDVSQRIVRLLRLGRADGEIPWYLYQ